MYCVHLTSATVFATILQSVGGDNVKTAKIQFLSAMGIFGTVGFFVKFIPLSSGVIALCRAVLGLAFLAVIMLCQRKRPDFSAIKKNLPVLLISGGIMGMNWVLLFQSYLHTTVATATVCYYFAPLMLLLASPLLGERLTPKKLICVAVALVGLVCVSGILKGGLPAPHELAGVLLGLGAAALYAGVMFLNKKLSPIPAYDKTVIQLGSAAAVIALYLLITGFAPVALTTTQWVLLLVVGIVHTGFAYVLYFGSMKDLSAKTIALFSYLDPVIAVLLSALLLHESLGVWDWVGTALILGSALYSELSE